MPFSNVDSEPFSSHNRHRLEKVSKQIEDILYTLGDAADEQNEELKARARNVLKSVRDIELRAQSRLDTAGRLTQNLVRERPWPIIVATAVAAYTLGLLTKGRG